MQDIQLSSGITLNKTPPVVIIQEESKEETEENQAEKEILMSSVMLKPLKCNKKLNHKTSGILPYVERIPIEKPVVRPQFDFENEVRNVCI